MKLLKFGISALGMLNNIVLKLSSAIAIVAITAMVISILVQVYFRYVIGNALPWPDEFARFCMLWMTGLMAPVAYRQGGMVAIDMLPDMLGKRSAAILSLVLFLISLLVLVMGIKLGLKHVNSGWLFSSATLKVPLSLVGMETIKLKLAYMYSSLWIGLILLTSVNVELILKSLYTLITGNPSDTDRAMPINIPEDDRLHGVAD